MDQHGIEPRGQPARKTQRAGVPCDMGAALGIGQAKIAPAGRDVV